MSADPLDALGDPTRRAILEVLAEGECSVGRLADRLPVSRPAVSKHLRLLEGAGLVSAEPAGTRRIYRLHADGRDAVARYLDRLWGETATRFRLAAENLDP